MSEISEKIRYILQYHFDQGDNASQSCEKICAIYDEGTLSKSTARYWFARFRSGNFEVKDEPRSGRPHVENFEEIFKKIHEDRHISTRDIAEELNMDQKTVLNHLKKAGYTKKLDVWVPHELSLKNLMDRVSVCEMLKKRNEIEPFLKKLITGDEKWIRYENLDRKRSWKRRGERPQTTSKPGLRLCCAFGGIGKELYTINCCRRA